jgi:hypothetical protein
MGQAFWACRSCVNFASTFGAKVNAKLKEVSDRVDALEGRMTENANGLEEAQQQIESVEKAVEKVENTVNNMEKQSEDGMLEELRAREAIKRNLVLYGVQEPDQNITEAKDRVNADKEECEKIFIAAGSSARRTDIRFCRRLGEKGEDKDRPILLGMKSETIKCEILDQARELRNTRYKDVGIGPDQTRKQKQAKLKLNEEADRKNREELTQEDRSKNLKWIVVGQRGEKRIVKATEREYNGDRRDQSARGGRGRGGRGRGTWSNDRTKRGRQEEDLDMEEERPRTRTKQ